MRTAEKVVFNTIVLYARVIISMAISLVSVPLVLKALGANDYGLYSLVAGVIAMLTFLNVSMNVATQRYLSVAMGTGDKEQLNTVFNVSLLLHFIIGSIIVIFFEVCGFFIFDGFLNIDPNRILAAKIVYQTLIISTFFSVISVPYGAVINAKEDMLFFSINHIIKDVLMLLLALCLSLSSLDRLDLYGIGVTLIHLIYVIISRSVVHIKYKEFSFRPKKYYSQDVFKGMFGFAGWNTFGAVATIGRNQGIAVVFNLFYGTIINAAYGVANQVNGVLNAMTATFSQSINPQLMKSKGMDNNERLERISMISSKFSFILYSFFAVPLIIEMSKVLKVWLGNPPEYTLVLSQLVIVLSMVHIYSNGLMSAIQATGKIAAYQVAMSILILLNIPICYVLLKLGFPPYSCLCCFIIIECISLVARMLFARRLVGIKMKVFFQKVILPTLSCVIFAVIIPLVIHFAMPESLFRVILVCLVYAVVYILVVWHKAFNEQERIVFVDMVRGIHKNKQKM